MTRLKLFVDEWPLVDQRMWAAFLVTGNPLDGPGAFSHLRASTIREREVGYGRWLAWLTEADPSALEEPSIERATAGRVTAWMGSLATLAPYTRVMRLNTLISVIGAADPAAELSVLKRIRQVHHAKALGNHGQRKVGRILSSDVLLQAGLDYAGSYADAAKSAFERARRLRDGTLLAFLSLLPIRRRSLLGLELGQSVLVTSAGIKIDLSEAMMKSGVAWEAMVPEPVESLLRRYLSDARPFLINRATTPHDQLWVTDTGRPFSYSYLGRRIPELTEFMTGIRVPPHFFRDAAATTLARESPEAARLIGPLLAHSSFRSAERHYNHARCIEAGAHYGDVVEALRKAN